MAKLNAVLLIVATVLLATLVGLQLEERHATNTRRAKQALKLADLSDTCKKAIYGEDAKSAMQQIVGSTECIRSTLLVLSTE